MLRFRATIFAALAICKLSDAQSVPPPASKRPVTDVYHGVQIVDEYRWLEDWANPETQAWSGSQNARARKYLDALPGRTALREQIRLLLSTPSADFRSLVLKGEILFALRYQPAKEQPFLVTLANINDPNSARVILDPVQLDPAGATAIDFYVPSRDGKYVAVSLSKGGSESGDVHIYETATGRELPDVIPRVNGGTAGGSIAWNGDGSGFYYTRYPRPGERPAADLHFYSRFGFTGSVEARMRPMRIRLVKIFRVSPRLRWSRRKTADTSSRPWRTAMEESSRFISSVRIANGFSLRTLPTKLSPVRSAVTAFSICCPISMRQRERC